MGCGASNDVLDKPVDLLLAGGGPRSAASKAGPRGYPSTKPGGVTIRESISRVPSSVVSPGFPRATVPTWRVDFPLMDEFGREVVASSAREQRPPSMRYNSNSLLQRAPSSVVLSDTAAEEPLPMLSFVLDERDGIQQNPLLQQAGGELVVGVMDPFAFSRSTPGDFAPLS